MTDEYEQIDLDLTLGGLLKAAREKKNLDVADVADHLRLKESTIREIENDEYADQSLKAFTRGYIRSYAKFVQVPDRELDMALEHAGIANVVPVCKGKHVKFDLHQPSYKDKSVKLVSYIIMSILVILVVGWWYLHNSNSSIGSKPAGVVVAVTNNNQNGGKSSQLTPDTTVAAANGSTAQNSASVANSNEHL